jgi:hypothetical protein
MMTIVGAGRHDHAMGNARQTKACFFEISMLIVRGKSMLIGYAGKKHALCSRWLVLAIAPCVAPAKVVGVGLTRVADEVQEKHAYSPAYFMFFGVRL